MNKQEFDELMEEIGSAKILWDYATDLFGTGFDDDTDMPPKSVCNVLRWVADEYYREAEGQEFEFRIDVDGDIYLNEERIFKAGRRSKA